MPGQGLPSQTGMVSITQGEEKNLAKSGPGPRLLIRKAKCTVREAGKKKKEKKKKKKKDLELCFQRQGRRRQMAALVPPQT